ncbi:MAG TPA: hypothetical protein VK176_12410 [Phycisphaerales bacterium]|nr:hypothetical protein [Phycisphaerales bacterium]
MNPEKLNKIKIFGSIGVIVIAGVIIAAQFMLAPAPGSDVTPKSDVPAAGTAPSGGKTAGKSPPRVYQTDRGTTVTEDNGIVVERVGGGVVAPGGGK